MRWRVEVILGSGASKSVIVDGYDRLDDAANAAMGLAGAVSYRFASTIGPSLKDSGESDLNDQLQGLSREADSLRDEVDNLRARQEDYEEMRNIDQEIKKCDDAISATYGEWAEELREAWDEENVLAYEEDRRPLTFAEVRLIYGDMGHNSFVPPMCFRRRKDGRVVLECIHCDQDIRIPNGKAGFIRCPHCSNEFYTDTTEDCDLAEIENFWRTRRRIEELDRKSALYE